MEQMVRDELQFDFKHGNIMEHVGILSHKITEGFQEVAATLRLNAVFDKELGTDEGESFFQTPDEYDSSRCALAQHLRCYCPACYLTSVLAQEKARGYSVGVGGGRTGEPVRLGAPRIVS